ncbi:2417_t:CDS:2, partial [Funneliformis mosseae]
SSTVTRIETTLFCLVHGEPSSSFFSITVENHENVAGLRKLIKEESEPYLDNFALVNIANILQGREFLPPNKVENIFTTQLNENNIHIIVELPTSHAPDSGSDNEILQFEQQISSVSASDWDKIQAFHGLDNIETINLAIKHLGLNVNDIVNVNAFDFLTTDAGIYLPLRLASTTNAVVVDRFFVAAIFPKCHIRIVFELKKRVENKDRYQALAELTRSDLRSNHAVLTVLTDLNDTWVFFWFEQKNVKTLTLPRNTAVALINNNMKLMNQENIAKENNQSEEGAST